MQQTRLIQDYLTVGVDSDNEATAVSGVWEESPRTLKRRMSQIVKRKHPLNPNL